jgi:hypothetical protein
MKKIIFLTVVLLTAASNASKNNTSCDITINGLNYTRPEIKIEVFIAADELNDASSIQEYNITFGISGLIASSNTFKIQCLSNYLNETNNSFEDYDYNIIDLFNCNFTQYFTNLIITKKEASKTGCISFILNFKNLTRIQQPINEDIVRISINMTKQRPKNQFASCSNEITFILKVKPATNLSKIDKLWGLIRDYLTKMAAVQKFFLILAGIILNIIILGICIRFILPQKNVDYIEDGFSRSAVKYKSVDSEIKSENIEILDNINNV